jgi:xanthine dehydrogenase YagT iron-sulfur-binding subunit
MPKRPKSDDPQADGDPKSSRRKGLGRREFVKLVGGTGAAVSAAVLAGEALLPAELKAQLAAPAGKVLGPGAVPITLRANGRVKRLTLEPRVTLLDALRDRLHLTGAKKVCDRGTCGACTVIVNGKAVYACMTLAIDVAERPGHPAADIQTIEGLAPEGQLHAVSAAFVDNDAQQCGFCTPGFVMACKAYLDAHPNPTYEQAQKALGGNLCRCGTYMGVRRAVLEAARRGAAGKGGAA